MIPFLNFAKYLYNNTEFHKIIITHGIIIIIFGLIYRKLSMENVDAFSTDFDTPMTLFDSIYYSAITHTTVGFGDVYPMTKTSKIACMVHVLLVFLISFLEINRLI